MFIDELRTIREELSLKTIDMNSEQLNAYYKKGADEAMEKIDKIRKETAMMAKQPIDMGARAYE